MDAKSSLHAEQFVCESATYRSQYLENRAESKKKLYLIFSSYFDVFYWFLAPMISDSCHKNIRNGQINLFYAYK